MTRSTVDLLGAVNRRLRRDLATALTAYDVSPGQVRALSIVADQGPLRLSALAEHLRIAARSATEVVDALEDRGLAERGGDPTDRRAVAVTATAEGQRLARLTARLRAERAEALLARLGPADRAELDRLLALLVEEEV